MAHSSKKAITGRLWFCTMPRRDQPSLLFMFLSSSHHILEAREEKSGSQKRPWPMPWNPRAVSASDFVPDVRLKGPIAFDTWQSFLFVFSLSKSPSRPLCRLSVTLVLYGYMAPWNCVTRGDMGMLLKEMEKSLKLLLTLTTNKGSNPNKRLNFSTVSKWNHIFYTSAFGALV